MNTILIIGANGFLGNTLLNVYKSKTQLQEEFSVIAGDISKDYIPSDIGFYNIDITNKDDLIRKVSKINPDIILLTAAMTDVDQCETKKELATNINFKGPKNVSDVCKLIDSKLVFMSTDFIFNGLKERLYTEEDIPKPQSHYAKTKFHGELSIIYSEIDFLICRTSVLYGWNPHKLNFITWVLKNLKQGKNLSIVTNQINSPTYIINLAEILFKLIEKKASGIVHTAGDCILNRYEMALKCAEIFNYDKKLISPIDNLEQKAQRPLNAGLNVSKLKQLLQNEIKIFNLDDGLKDMKNNKIN